MNDQNYNFKDDSVIQLEEKSVSKKFFADVFLWMFVALGLSTGAAYAFGTDASLMEYLIRSNPDTGRVGMTVFGYVAAFAPLGLVLLMGVGFRRFSFPALLGVFVIFSVLLGISLSFILSFYQFGSVVTCFASASAIFGVMAFLGYTTNVDLSKFGPILFAGVIALFISGLINMFIQSEQFSLFRAFIGVAVFTALTAYDVQMIKRMGMGLEQDGEAIGTDDKRKLALMAALSLYLDFVNIFLFLLRIFGSRK